MKKLLILLLILISFSQCVYDDYEPISNETSTETNTDTDTSTDTNTDTNTDNSGNDNNTTDNTTNNKITYYTHVKPIINQLCVSCHGSVDPKDDLDLSTYTNVKNRVDKIIKAMDKQNGDSDIMPPSGRADDAYIQTIKDWKTDGLLEGEESTVGGGNADGNITYTTDIKAVLDQECTACHSSTNSSGGLNLTTYTFAKNNINVIISRIDLQTGNTGIMPPAGRMDEAKIQLFKDWLNQGLLEQ